MCIILQSIAIVLGKSKVVQYFNLCKDASRQVESRKDYVFILIKKWWKSTKDYNNYCEKQSIAIVFVKTKVLQYFNLCKYATKD